MVHTVEWTGATTAALWLQVETQNRDPLAPRNTDNEFQTLPALSGGFPRPAAPPFFAVRVSEFSPQIPEKPARIGQDAAFQTERVLTLLPAYQPARVRVASTSASTVLCGA